MWNKRKKQQKPKQTLDYSVERCRRDVLQGLFVAFVTFVTTLIAASALNHTKNDVSIWNLTTYLF